jgi:hypothetical protein
MNPPRDYVPVRLDFAKVSSAESKVFDLGSVLCSATAVCLSGRQHTTERWRSAYSFFRQRVPIHSAEPSEIEGSLDADLDLRARHYGVGGDARDAAGRQLAH